MGNLASAMTRLDDARPRPGRRGVRDHRPRARHPRGAAPLPRPHRQELHRRHRPDRRDRRGREVDRGRHGREAAHRRLRGRRPHHPGDRHRQRRRGADLLGPDHVVRSSSPTTSTPCWESPDRDRPARLQSIPSPSSGVWHLGPVPIRGYALAIILGIVAAIWIGERRWAGPRRPARGGPGPRRLGGAVRPGRRPALPRGHRPRALLRRGRRPVADPLRLARRPRGLGLDLPGRGRRDHRRQAARDADRADGRRPGARASWSPRRWAAGATGSTRSCSASPPTCPGRSRSTPSTGRPATRTRRPSTRRSSTSSAGTCSSSGC